MEISPWLLVYSNLFYIVPAAVLLYKSWRDKLRWNIELAALLCVGIASSTHHLCDTPQLDHCLQHKYSLYFLDLLFSYLALAMAFSPFLSENARALYHIYALTAPLLLLLFLEDSVIAPIVLIAVGVVVFIASQIKGWFANILEHWEVVVGTLLFGAAIYFKILSDEHEAGDEEYLWAHSLWHIFGALAITALYWDLPFLDPHSYSRLQGKTTPSTAPIMGI